MGSDGDFGRSQRQYGIAKIMGASAEICLLCHGGPFPDFYLAQGVGVRSISQAGAVMQGEIPRKRNAGALMDKWRAMDGGTEES